MLHSFPTSVQNHLGWGYYTNPKKSPGFNRLYEIDQGAYISYVKNVMIEKM
jgi:hypothetical protein